MALSFDSEVRARLLECDLHFPSHCKDRDDFGRIHIEVGAEERLWFPFSVGVAYQDPSECCWWSADSIPQTGLGDKLDRCFFRAMPIRWRSPCPAFVSGVQIAFEFGERPQTSLLFAVDLFFLSREEARKDWHQVSTDGNYMRKCATNMFGPGFPMIIYKCTLVMKNSVSILPTNPHISTPRSAFAKLCPPLAHFRM